MALNKMGLTKEIEGIIDRLEEARSNALVVGGDLSEMGFRGSDLDSDIIDDIEGAEAALLVAENRLDQVIQVMDEEIDNLRKLIEAIAEDL